MKRIIFSIFCIYFFNIGCTDVNSPENPPHWVNELISEYQSQPLGNPPQSIWQYTYMGETVYYIPPQCCDQFSELYDKEGDSICAPDGGISGHGDGRCPDFFKERKNEKLIWKDSRRN